MVPGRVVLAMSGGVDSSVSAHLLRERGFDIVGVFMRTGATREPADAGATTGSAKKIRGCCSALDAGDAQRVADRLDIPFYALDFENEFDRIKDYFADEYLAARTPNPCVVCNTWLKFGKLWDYATAIGADYIATGHYARTATTADGATVLRRAVDPAKDQSYFLFGLGHEMLERLLFPVGEMEKPAVRALANRYGLEVAAKPDSQEICFVPDGQHHEFVRRHRPGALIAGEIVEAGGRVVGRHDGISKFTIGQRKGLGVALGAPRYVVSLDPEAHRVVIGPKELLQRDSLEADRCNWLLPAPPTGPVRCSVKIRYLHAPAPAVVTPVSDHRVDVRFDQPQSAIAPGQAAVFYDDDRVLGGGWIA